MENKLENIEMHVGNVEQDEVPLVQVKKAASRNTDPKNVGFSKKAAVQANNRITELLLAGLEDPSSQQCVSSSPSAGRLQYASPSPHRLPVDGDQSPPTVCQ